MKYSISALIAASIFLFTTSSNVFAAQWSSNGYKETSYLSDAKEEINDKRYGAAIVQLKKAIAEDKDNADAYNLLGFSHRKLKQYELAESYYEKALALEPDHVGAMEYLGELYVETGRMELAKAMLKRLDDNCLFLCLEHRKLKRIIDAQDQDISTEYEVSMYE